MQEIYGGEYRGAYAGNTCIGNWPPIPIINVFSLLWGHGTGCMLSLGSSEGYLAPSQNEHAPQAMI